MARVRLVVTYPLDKVDLAKDDFNEILAKRRGQEGIHITLYGGE